jgi:hypothetical protein
LGIKYTKWRVWNDGIDATIVTGNAPSNRAIIAKLDFENAKSNLTNVKNPVWNLMMKNIYQIPELIR